MAVTASPNDQLLALSREMLASAEESDWEKLAELEQNRQPLFYQVFDQIESTNADLAREVLSIDEKTRQLAEKGMPVLQQELLMLRSSGIANTAYQTVQDFASSGDD
jgi:hypothetical protein